MSEQIFQGIFTSYEAKDVSCGTDTNLNELFNIAGAQELACLDKGSF